jgi:hypothetical protein
MLKEDKAKQAQRRQGKASYGKVEYRRQSNQRNGTVVPTSVAEKESLLS